MPVPKGQRFGGRRKGTPNKLTGDVKSMVVAALDKAGGEDYLLHQARTNPTAFMSLLGKVLPLQVNGDVGGKLIVEWAKEPITGA